VTPQGVAADTSHDGGSPSSATPHDTAAAGLGATTGGAAAPGTPPVPPAPIVQTNATPPSTGVGRRDSATKDPAPTSIAQSRKSPLRHPWLRTNGDSGEARDPGEGAGPEELARAQLDELQGHLALGMRHASRGDVAHARIAFRDAMDEARGLKLADRSLTFRIDLALRNAQRDAYHACQTGQADTTNVATANGDCGTLFAW
jgi:hypothetical protein